MARKDPTPSQRERLIKMNANRCCVCKRQGIGFNLHHIDGNNSNTVDKNLAVLCVEDHDHHHRPTKYTKAKHLDLSQRQLLKYKNSWEAFVENARSQSPSVIAVVNLFGSLEQIHSGKILFQWPDENIEFERTFHLLEGDFEYWIDEMLTEVQSIGQNIKITMVDQVLPIEYCPCCRIGYSHTIKEAWVTKITNPNWKLEWIMSIYINPTQPSLAIVLGIPNKHLYTASLHLCCKTHLHYASDHYEERIQVKKHPSIRSQATRLIEKVIAEWEPGNIIIATGNPDSPEQIEDFILPKVWENRRPR